MAKYINEGKLLAIQSGVTAKEIRYKIKGEWIIDFIKRYKKGLVKIPYNKEATKKLLENAIKNLR
jgi:hypothetical protein